MPLIEYKGIRFNKSRMARLYQAIAVIENISAQGYTLTLRQLYYQMVKANLIPNKFREYKNLGELISDARLAGIVDWDHLCDRTRSIRDIATWDSPSDAMYAIRTQYKEDLWKSQPCRVEVWIEKDALIEVAEKACEPMRVPCFSCRGYTSQSSLWQASQRHIGFMRNDQEVHVIHLGDHDPSGIDMTRDIEDRLALFCEHEGLDAPTIHRIALNMDQIRKFKPPPNPAKVTDSRAKAYIKKFGHDSWELDALDPSVIDGLIQNKIRSLVKRGEWIEAESKENDSYKVLEKIEKKLKKDEANNDE